MATKEDFNPFPPLSPAKLVHQDLLPNPLSVGNIVFQLTTYKRPKSDEKLTLSGSEGNPETENGGGEKWWEG
eukprot:785126-Amorphochlora_amoeboformis.AAC.1